MVCVCFFRSYYGPKTKPVNVLLYNCFRLLYFLISSRPLYFSIENLNKSTLRIPCHFKPKPWELLFGWVIITRMSKNNIFTQFGIVIYLSVFFLCLSNVFFPIILGTQFYISVYLFPLELLLIEPYQVCHLLSHSSDDPSIFLDLKNYFISNLF